MPTPDTHFLLGRIDGLEAAFSRLIEQVAGWGSPGLKGRMSSEVQNLKHGLLRPEDPEEPRDPNYVSGSLESLSNIEDRLKERS